VHPLSIILNAAGSPAGEQMELFLCPLVEAVNEEHPKSKGKAGHADQKREHIQSQESGADGLEHRS